MCRLVGINSVTNIGLLFAVNPYYPGATKALYVFVQLPGTQIRGT